jgi:hypothetical protein
VHSGRVLKPRQGSMVVFSGSNMHEGLAVTEGTRYLVAGFLRYHGSIMEFK